MSSHKSLLYRLGYALEQARHAPEPASRTLAGLKERTAAGTRKASRAAADKGVNLDEVLTTAGIALAVKVLDKWRPRQGPGVLGLLRAGAAGAAAAFFVEMVRPLVAGDPRLPELDEETTEKMLLGAVQGVLYGTVEGWVPGSPILKGALFGSVEYATLPLGGLGKLLRSQTPLKRIPAVNEVLAELDEHERDFLEEVTFGVALALLYGSSESNNGMRGDGA